MEKKKQHIEEEKKKQQDLDEEKKQDLLVYLESRARTLSRLPREFHTLQETQKARRQLQKASPEEAKSLLEIS